MKSEALNDRRDKTLKDYRGRTDVEGGGSVKNNFNKNGNVWPPYLFHRLYYWNRSSEVPQELIRNNVLTAAGIGLMIFSLSLVVQPLRDTYMPDLDFSPLLTATFCFLMVDMTVNLLNLSLKAVKQGFQFSLFAVKRSLAVFEEPRLYPRPYFYHFKTAA